MCNRDNAHDVDIFRDEKITKRSEPINQAQAKINIVKGLQTYLNDLKNDLATYQGFKIRLEIIKILGKYWYIFNKWRIVQGLVPTSAITFIALDFLERQFLSLWWEHQSDNFQKLSLHFSAIYQSDNYQNFLMVIALIYRSNMLVQRNTNHGLVICKVLFVFYSKTHFSCNVEVIEVMLLK